MTLPPGRARVFIDTSGFYAAAARTDAHHPQARAVLERLSRERSQLLTTSLVVAECHALFLSRIGHDAAVKFLRGLDGSAIEVVRPTRPDEGAARDIIYRYHDKDFSLTDALSFAVMQRLRIPAAFSFDRDFRQFGFPAVDT